MSQVIEDVKREAQNRSLIPRSILVPVVTLAALIVLVIPAVLYVLRKKAREDGEWEIEAGPYKELATATRGFNDTMLLGEGGFGKVYRGVLQNASKPLRSSVFRPSQNRG